MKQIFSLFILVALLALCSCGGKSQVKVVSQVPADTVDAIAEVSVNADKIICEALQTYLMGDESAVEFSDAAKEDLNESTWPEVQCGVDEFLYSPSEFKDLEVKKVGEGLYKYECVCPEHGDRYVDFCTIQASLSSEDKVIIDHVTWD